MRSPAGPGMTGASSRMARAGFGVSSRRSRATSAPRSSSSGSACSRFTCASRPESDSASSASFAASRPASLSTTSLPDALVRMSSPRTHARSCTPGNVRRRCVTTTPRMSSVTSLASSASSTIATMDTPSTSFVSRVPLPSSSQAGACGVAPLSDRLPAKRPQRARIADASGAPRSTEAATRQPSFLRSARNVPLRWQRSTVTSADGEIDTRVAPLSTTRRCGLTPSAPATPSPSSRARRVSGVTPATSPWPSTSFITSSGNGLPSNVTSTSSASVRTVTCFAPDSAAARSTSSTQCDGSAKRWSFRRSSARFASMRKRPSATFSPARRSSFSRSLIAAPSRSARSPPSR